MTWGYGVPPQMAISASREAVQVEQAVRSTLSSSLNVAPDAINVAPWMQRVWGWFWESRTGLESLP